MIKRLMDWFRCRVLGHLKGVAMSDKYADVLLNESKGWVGYRCDHCGYMIMRTWHGY